MAIEMVGGVYCPLSPRDPEFRLNQLIEQMDRPLVFVHWLTKRKFMNKSHLSNLDMILMNYGTNIDAYLRQLFDVIPTDNMAYIIFTSGSTGLPKAVSTNHSALLVHHNIVLF